jgi:inner membrane protein
MSALTADRSPGAKLGLALLIGFLLSFPLFTVWLLVYDRQQQSEYAQASIAEGWGGPQTISGPLLVIPYQVTATETKIENGRQVTSTRTTWRELTLSPEAVALDTQVNPERRQRSIYEVVVYDADVAGQARFAIPQELSRFDVEVTDLDLSRAQLRFGLTDPRGLGANPRVSAGGRTLRLQPGGGGGSPGFFARLDARSLLSSPLVVEFAYDLRGNRSLGLAPDAGDTRWRLKSSWPHPSFQGSFLPEQRVVNAQGFDSIYRVGNLASAASWSPPATSAPPPPRRRRRRFHRTLQHESGGPAAPRRSRPATASSPRSAWSSRSTSIRGSTARPSTASCSSASPSWPSSCST